MCRSRQACFLAAVMAASTLPTGCGGAVDDLPREGVSGKVTFNGQPLKTGTIQFQPGDPGAATAGSASVVDGQYAIPKSEGLVPGKYRVTVTGGEAVAGPAKGAMPGDPLPPPKEPIPAKYNAESTLSAAVTKEGPNTFSFELKSR